MVNPARSPWQAVVFDFDGLILDTETPLYEAWRRTFEHHGVEPISLDEWSLSLGLHETDPGQIDPFARLIEVVGTTVTPGEADAMWRRHRDELLAIEVFRPGVVELLDQADFLGIPVGIATSSRPYWIDHNLGPRELLHRFAVVACATDEVPGKPDPATYLAACAALGADPSQSLALEDSPNGVRAAKAAGLFCVAVPNAVSAGLDLTHADVVIESLVAVDLAAPRAQVVGAAGPS